MVPKGQLISKRLFGVIVSNYKFMTSISVNVYFDLEERKINC